MLTFLFILILIGATVGILAVNGVFSRKNGGKNSGNNSTESIQTHRSYINPTPFKTGYLDNPPQHLADLCRSGKGGNNVMYPIQPIYVDYGEREGGDCCGGECDVNIFNSPP